jgi:oxygen-independent coproporphyrinogen-3 oxidase
MARFRSIAGRDLPQAKIAELVADGMLKIDDTRLQTTQNGRLLLNAILRELLVN